MNNIEIIGFVAGILVALSLVPQIFKSWHSRSTQDVAMSWLIINISGQIMWIIYGNYLESWPIIITSGLILIMNVFMIFLKIKFD
jgi:MtN3 and saliva related transmembrane protein